MVLMQNPPPTPPTPPVSAGTLPSGAGIFTVCVPLKSLQLFQSVMLKQHWNGDDPTLAEGSREIQHCNTTLQLYTAMLQLNTKLQRYTSMLHVNTTLQCYI